MTNVIKFRAEGFHPHVRDLFASEVARLQSETPVLPGNSVSVVCGTPPRSAFVPDHNAFGVTGMNHDNGNAKIFLLSKWFSEHAGPNPIDRMIDHFTNGKVATCMQHPAAVLTHEYGHCFKMMYKRAVANGMPKLDSAVKLGKHFQKSMTAVKVGGVPAPELFPSRYSMSNFEEYFAEVFAARIYGGKLNKEGTACQLMDRLINDVYGAVRELKRAA